LKRAGLLFDEIGERDNWKLAWLKAIRGKSRGPLVLRLREKLEANLESLRESFVAGTFRFGDYEYFTIRDPKTRIICAASFPERIVQHAMMNVLDPVFERYQISDSYACRQSKGTQAAVLRAFHLVKSGSWFLKMDVRKYFDSISHAHLKLALRRRLKDERVLTVLDAIIDSYETSPGRGIPIGNLTSQYFANHYLAALDHQAREVWRCGVWVRYMDDVLACVGEREEIERLYESCRDFCAAELALELKPKIIERVEKGAPFLGFLIKPTGIFLARKGKRRFRASSRTISHELERRTISETKASERMTAVCAHTAIARARGFRYAVFYGRFLGRQPRESRGQLEQ
jgi:retron-type reverse transcriptase